MMGPFYSYRSYSILFDKTVLIRSIGQSLHYDARLHSLYGNAPASDKFALFKRGRGDMHCPLVAWRWAAGICWNGLHNA